MRRFWAKRHKGFHQTWKNQGLWKKNWDPPTLFEFNDWLKHKAEAHDRMRLSSREPKTEDSNLFTKSIRTKTGTKTFASTSSSQTPSLGDKADNPPTSCIACRGKRPLWRCSVFREKTPTQRTKIVEHNKLCFSCLNGQKSLRKWPKPCKRLNPGSSSSQKTQLYGSERLFPQKAAKN